MPPEAEDLHGQAACDAITSGIDISDAIIVVVGDDQAAPIALGYAAGAHKTSLVFLGASTPLEAPLWLVADRIVRDDAELRRAIASITRREDAP